MNYVSYIWIFFAVICGFYTILLFMDYDKVIPDSFRKKRGHPFYDTWRTIAASAMLILTASFILFTMSEYNTSDASIYWLLRGFAIFMVILGVIVLYFINKKGIEIFSPSYFAKEDEKKKNKKSSKKEEEGK